MLDRISVCLPRELAVAAGDRLHLKGNRKLASGGRVTNGELVTVKSVCADGGIELTDGRVLDREFREFLPGYIDMYKPGRDQRPQLARFLDVLAQHRVTLQQQRADIEAQLTEIGAFEKRVRNQLGGRRRRA